MEQIISLTNNNTQYTNDAKVKIAKCVKCKKHESVAWIFEHMAWYRGYC